MISHESRPPATGPTAGLLLLIMLPFLLKAAVVLWGVTGYAAQSSYKLVQLAAPIYWRWRFDAKRGWSIIWPFDEPRPSVRLCLQAVGIAAVLAGTAIITIVALDGPLQLDPSQVKQGMEAKFALTTMLAISIVVYLFTLNAAMEELHFRAWIDRQLHARFGNLTGMLGSAALFAAMHLFIFSDLRAATPLLLVMVFLALALAGICWSWLLRRPGGIHAAWFSHGLTNAALLTWSLSWLGYF